jgi:citrate synthase
MTHSDFRKGLEGIVAVESEFSYIDGEKGNLESYVYCQYCAKCQNCTIQTVFISLTDLLS